MQVFFARRIGDAVCRPEHILDLTTVTVDHIVRRYVDSMLSVHSLILGIEKSPKKSKTRRKSKAICPSGAGTMPVNLLTVCKDVARICRGQ